MKFLSELDNLIHYAVLSSQGLYMITYNGIALAFLNFFKALESHSQEKFVKKKLGFVTRHFSKFSTI